MPNDVVPTAQPSQVQSSTLDTEVQIYLGNVDDNTSSLRRGDSSYQFYPGAERDTYDYNNERFGIHKTTLVESIVHMIKGATGAGAGLMAMHEAFMYGGLWASLGTIILIGLINTYTMYMVAKCAHLMYFRLRVSRLSYSELAEVAVASGSWKYFRKFSKHFRLTVDLFIVIYMLGTCCAYQIMIANTLKQVLEVVVSESTNYFDDDIRIYMLITAPVLMIMCIIRSLTYLAPFSLLADIFMAVCVLVTIYYSFQTDHYIDDHPAWKDFDSFLRFCGICLFCTCGIAICLAVENNMKRPRQFVYVLNWAMGVEVVILAATGFFGYWGWGENCKSPIITHMPRNAFTAILLFLLGVMLSITFVVQFWVAFKIIWYYVSKRTSANFSVRFERIFRLLFTIPVTGLSVLVPDMIALMSFIGLFILAFVNFLFPVFIETLITFKYDRQLQIRWRMYKNFSLFTFGCLVLASGIHLAVVDYTAMKK